MSSFAPGNVIGGYEIVGLLGRGGMGAVYKARRGDAEFALKTLLDKAGPDEQARFAREAQILAQLRHPAIVPVHAAGQANGLSYFVMGLVPGESLEHRLKREGPLAPEAAVKLLREIALGVAHAHGHGIVHRDLKPANILLDDETGYPRIADFGLARDSGSQEERLTRTGEIMGTPAYMAPEQALGIKSELDAKVDIYALGAILYAALSGQAPYSGRTTLETLQKVSNDEPDPLVGVPPALEALVRRTMSKKREERPATAGEFARELAAALAAPTGAGMGRGVQLLLGLAFVSILGTGALVTVRLLPRKPAPTTAAPLSPSQRLDQAVDRYADDRDDAYKLAYQATRDLPEDDRGSLARELRQNGDVAFLKSDWKGALAHYDLGVKLLPSVSPERHELERRVLAARLASQIREGKPETGPLIVWKPKEERATFPLGTACALYWSWRLAGDSETMIASAELENIPPTPEVRRELARRWFAKALEAQREALKKGSLMDDLERSTRLTGSVLKPLGEAAQIDSSIGIFPAEFLPMFAKIRNGGAFTVARDSAGTAAKEWENAFRGWEHHPSFLLISAFAKRNVAVNETDPAKLAADLAALFAVSREMIATLRREPDGLCPAGRALAEDLAFDVLLPVARDGGQAEALAVIREIAAFVDTDDARHTVLLAQKQDPTWEGKDGMTWEEKAKVWEEKRVERLNARLRNPPEGAGTLTTESEK